MTRTVILLALLIAASCYLQVYAPQELLEKFQQINGNRLPYSTANFGEIPYGKQMMGEVIIANPLTNCEFEQDLADENKGVKQNRFVLAVRGDCSFVQKVHNAQEEGAKLAIIMDDRIEKTERLIMANDGQGNHLKIPSIFINENDGELIVQWSSENPEKPVILSVKFETNITDIVEVGLWLDIETRGSYRFVRDFKPLYEKVKDKGKSINVSVFYSTFACAKQLCKEVDCYGDYNYCQLDPDGPLPGTGRTVIEQQLREYFVFQSYPDKWWQYVLLTDEHCADYATLETCSKISLNSLKINPDEIQNKVKEEISSGKVLQKQAELRYASGVIFFPDVTINKIPYLGQLDGIEVFEMICNSLNSPPADCNSFVYDPQKIVPIPEPESHVATIVTLVTVSLVLFFLFMVCIYRRFIRRRLSREMNSQVNQLVSQYITLFETKKLEETAEPSATAP